MEPAVDLPGLFERLQHVLLAAPARGVAALRDALHAVPALHCDPAWTHVPGAATAHVYTVAPTCAEPCSRVLLRVHDRAPGPPQQRQQEQRVYDAEGTVLGQLGAVPGAPWCVWPDHHPQPLLCTPLLSGWPSGAAAGHTHHGAVWAELRGVLPAASSRPSTLCVRWLLAALPASEHARLAARLHAVFAATSAPSS